jgi:hypothetical protein
MALTLVGEIGNKRIRPYTGPAGTAYGLAVKQGASDGACILPTAANQRCLGIVNETDTLQTGILAVVWEGETIAICGAAVAANDWLIANATGQLITSTAIGDEVIARAVTSTAAAGDEVLVQLGRFIR